MTAYRRSRSPGKIDPAAIAKLAPWPTDQATLTSLTGYAGAASSLWTFDSLNDKIGANNLTIGGSGASLVTPGVNPAMPYGYIQSSDGSSSSAEAGDVFDSNAGTSITICGVCIFTGTPGGTRIMMGKGGGSRYELEINAAGRMRARMFSAQNRETDVTTTDFFDGRVVYWMMKMNRTSNEMNLYTSEGDSPTDDISGVGNVGNSSNFAMLGTRLTSPPQLLGCGFVYEGAPAEAAPSSIISNLAAAQGN